MRKALLYLFLLFLSSSIFGQDPVISLTPNPQYEEGSASTSVIQADVVVKNVSDQELNLLWRRVIISTPQGWLSQICDKRLCYLPEVSQCPEAYPNHLLPGEEITMRVDILPQGVAGQGEIHVELFDINDQETVLATIEAHFTTATTSTNGPSGKADLKIYPNPTSNYFKLSNYESISKLSIYNIVGNAVRDFIVSGDDSYAVADLPEGIYLVRLFDHRKNVIKTVRLSKR